MVLATFNLSMPTHKRKATSSTTHRGMMAILREAEKMMNMSIILMFLFPPDQPWKRSQEALFHAIFLPVFQQMFEIMTVTAGW